ncbi:MAG: aminopeptidase [Ignavibacteriales bacterium]|nr:aminopeptidase [Ignavibacteriales bacterium]
MYTVITSIAFDEALTPGARNAVKDCLRLQPSERITIITDKECAEIAASLVHEIEKIGSEYHVFVMEDYAERPLKDMPQVILDDLAKSQVSIFAAITHTGELGSRIQMTSVVNKNKIRHGHMVNINKQIMMEGMRADFLEVDRISERLVKKARATKIIKTKTDAGTDFVAEFSPSLKWLKTSGIISPDKWGNLPGGEIFTSPFNTNGMFVVDGVVGDYLCQKWGDIQKHPLFIEVVDNRIKSVECSNKELLKEFLDYTHTDENSNRVGEFAIGTNIALKNIIGHILQDEKFPGIHIAFGHPYADHTGQNWVSTTHIDCVGRNFDIWMDDVQVMRKGKFIFENF